MKNKVALIAIGVIGIIGVIGGAFAYFTDTVEVKNEFQTKPYGSQVTEEFTSPENWLPGDTTPKTVVVKNTGEVDEAVRVSYTEKWESANGNTLSGTQTIGGTSVRAAIINFDNAADWTKVGDYYYYNKKLVSGRSTSSFIKSVTFNSQITADTSCTTVNNVTKCESTGNGYDGAKYTLTINVETVQFNVYKNIWNTTVNIAE